MYKDRDFGIDNRYRLLKFQMTRLKKNSLLDNLLSRKRVTQNEFQWLTGMLSLCARALPSGRAFTRRLYVSLKKVQNITI